MQSLNNTTNSKPSSVCVTVSVKNAPHATGFVDMLTQITRKQLSKRKASVAA